MALFPKSHPSQRAPRHKIAIPTQVIFVYGDGAQARGRLHVVSQTGGCAGMETPLSPATLVSVQVHTAAGTINAVAEMLPPLDAARQPFRFLAMDEADSSRLERFVAM